MKTNENNRKREGTEMKTKKLKRKIHLNQWGNWRGYEGGRWVAEFGVDDHFNELAARAWRDGTPCSGPECKGYWSKETDYLCTVCCAEHSEACDACGQKGYHAASCPSQQEEV